MKRRDFTFFMAAAAAAASGATYAQAYPTKPIRMIIPSTPGGGTDFIGRTMSVHLAEMNGWTVVPENRPGAGTALGLAEGARANPAGYDLVVGQADNLSLIPWLMKVQYDPLKDFTPVALVATTPMVLIVSENSPFKTLADAIRAAKANPGGINYGTSGTGGTVHVAMELLQIAADFKMQHVPYKGSAPALADLMGGHLGFAGSSISSAAGLLQSGKIRALAVTSPKRNAALPNVPTVAESGYKDFSVVSYYGILGPAGMPPAIVKRLNDDFNKILQKPEVSKALMAQGLEASAMSPDEFGALIKTDVLRSKDIIQTAHIKID